MTAQKMQRTVVSKRRVRLMLRMAGFALALSVLLSLLSLLAIGLPGTLTSRIVRQLNSQGIPLRFDSVRLSIHRGWVLRNVRFYSNNPDDLRPLLSAPKLYVRAWPESWRDLASTEWYISASAAKTDLSLGRTWEDLIDPQYALREITHFKTVLTFSPDRVSLHTLHLFWGGIQIDTEGTLIRSSGPSQRVPSPEPPGISNLLHRVAETVSELNPLDFEESPHLYVRFHADMNDSAENRADLSLSAEGLLWNQVPYGNLLATLQYRDKTFSSTVSLIQEGVAEANLSGSFNTDSGIARLMMTNSLPAEMLTALLPDSVQSALSAADAELFGRLDFSATLGPAPYPQLLQDMDLTVNQAQFRYEDLSVDPVSFQLLGRGRMLEVQDLHGRLNGGPLDGSAAVNLDTKAWTADLSAQCNPSPVGRLVGGWLEEFIDRFEFPSDLPHASLKVSHDGVADSLRIQGQLRADQFSCSDVPIDHVESALSYSNKMTTLSDLKFRQNTKTFDGLVRVDLNDGTAFFDAESSFLPHEVIQVLAPGKIPFLSGITYNGPVHGQATGSINFRNRTDHAVKGVFEAEQAVVEGIQINRFGTKVRCEGVQLIFTNSTARVCGGTLAGNAVFDLFPSDGTSPYQVHADASGLDFAQLLKQVSTNDHKNIRGTLSGNVHLSADAAAGFWPSVNGTGLLQVTDGHLSDYPLLGGFSRLIRSSIPGFSLFSLTTFSADFALHDAAIYSDNVRLGGMLLSAAAKGHYSPENGLDFTVRAEPLRQIREDKEWYQVHLWAADILKEGTSPFFKVLEMQLNGPLDDPRWSFANLPSSLPGIPRKGSGSSTTP